MIGATAARLGRYELLARIAQGGMGEIFLARLEGAAGFEKLVVIKRILPHLADDARFRAMLIGEARLASRMSHANICQVYELGETDGRLYIVMEYLEGVTVLPLLRRASKEGSQLDLGLVAGIVQQTTDALHYAHELRDRSGESLGIVHRDVTPSNVFLTESGVIKVLDFGIAKVKDASAQTQTGTVKGKYAYMAPEQLRGASIDRRVDVFALGVVLYEMLALRRLFQRKTDYLTFRAVMEQPIADIRRYRPDTPPALAEVVARALDRDPANRFETARQLGAAVLDAIAPSKRPWTQGDIGDFVRTQFAGDLRERGSQIAELVKSGIPTGLDEPLPDEEDDFPEVESLEGDAGEFHPATPAPFAADSTSSGSQLSPLTPPAPVPTAAVAPHKRSVVWPIVAVGGVIVAAGALVLVWQQMHQAPPAVVNITTEPTDVPQVVDLDNPTGSAGSAGSAATATTATATAPQPQPRPTAHPSATAVADRAAIIGRKSAADACVTQFGKPPPKTRVVIQIGDDGRATSVAIDPAAVDGTPLGGCIKDVFKTAQYGKGPARPLSINLK